MKRKTRQKRQIVKPNNQTSSDILLQIANDNTLDKELTYNMILKKLGKRSFGIALIVFALPSALPLSAIPGISFLFSIPIAIFAIELIFAKNAFWLPRIIGERKISKEKFTRIVNYSVPYLKKMERLIKPRWKIMNSNIMKRIHGVIILCLTLLLMLPIPFSNFIYSILIILISFGLMENDGVVISLAYIGFIFNMLFIYIFFSATIQLF